MKKGCTLIDTVDGSIDSANSCEFAARCGKAAACCHGDLHLARKAARTQITAPPVNGVGHFLRQLLFLILLSSVALADTPMPVSLTEVAQRGLPIFIDTVVADIEVDIPLLLPDGNILHLLGMTHPRVLPDTPFVEVIADLKGVTLPDCVAHVEILVSAATHHSLAQKLKMSCLGQTIHDAFTYNSPLPPGEGQGEGAAQ